MYISTVYVHVHIHIHIISFIMLMKIKCIYDRYMFVIIYPFYNTSWYPWIHNSIDIGMYHLSRLRQTFRGCPWKIQVPLTVKRVKPDACAEVAEVQPQWVWLGSNFDMTNIRYQMIGPVDRLFCWTWKQGTRKMGGKMGEVLFASSRWATFFSNKLRFIHSLHRRC